MSVQMAALAEGLITQGTEGRTPKGWYNMVCQLFILAERLST